MNRQGKAIPFTPGPWEVDSGMVQTVAEHACHTPGCGVHIPIAYMDRNTGNGTVPVERDANAHLIAAAPELLLALRNVTTALKASNIAGHSMFGSMVVKHAEEVMAKAEYR